MRFYLKLTFVALVFTTAFASNLWWLDLREQDRHIKTVPTIREREQMSGHTWHQQKGERP